MRGGTSKCWLFDAADIAALGVDAGSVLAAAFGSVDAGQLDGVGGATSTTSKAAIIEAGTEPGIDIEYTFAQVGIGARSVEWGSNCGNCATAIGLYAVQNGLVPAGPERTTVRMRNVNTGTLLATTIGTPGGSVPESGSATVPGVSAGGVPVELAFVDPAGGTTGALLPTGRPVDELLSGSVRARATLVDAGAPAALLAAADLRLTGAETIDTFASRVTELAGFRRAAALAMGLAQPADPIRYAVPKVGVVGPPVDYLTTNGTPIAGADYDISVRMVSMHAPHPAIGLTSAVALAAAVGLPDGVLAGLLPGPRPTTVRLGTPAGVITARAERDVDGHPIAVSLLRAARRIAVADVFVPLGTDTVERPEAAALLNSA